MLMCLRPPLPWLESALPIIDALVGALGR